jgi:hypothetical protein
MQVPQLAPPPQFISFPCSAYAKNHQTTVAKEPCLVAMHRRQNLKGN